MVLISSNSSENLNKYSHSELIHALNLDIDKLLYAARNANILSKILKEIIIDNELKNSNLTKSDWRIKIFNERVEEVFIEKKSNLEKVSFWYLTFADKSEAMETYYQLCNNEVTFSELKEINSNTRFFSDKLFTKLEAFMSRSLAKSKINVPIKPIRTKKGYLLLQKQSVNLVKLDNKLRTSILIELEEAWFRRELDRLLEK